MIQEKKADIISERFTWISIIPSISSWLPGFLDSISGVPSPVLPPSLPSLPSLPDYLDFWIVQQVFHLLLYLYSTIPSISIWLPGFLDSTAGVPSPVLDPSLPSPPSLPSTPSLPDNLDFWIVQQVFHLLFYIHLYHLLYLYLITWISG